MGPNSSEAPGLNLPPPVEQATPAEPAEAGPASAEQAPPAAAPEQAPQPASQPAAAATPMPLPTLPLAPARQGQIDDVSATTTTANLTARDADLIEKEWVNKAKQIVEKTRDDPYKQSEEMTVVKADYLKKRYNKAIKLNK